VTTKRTEPVGALLALTGWTGGVLGVGSLAALGVAWRRKRRSGSGERAGGSAADAADLEADPA
jgi:hypothetical protein